MSRYIDIDEVSKYPIRRNHYDKVNGSLDFVNGIESVIEYIENIPTADVRENIKGKWTEIQTAFEKYKPAGCFSFELKKYTRKKYRCSNCGKTKQYKENFCPNCGADMREVKE